MGFRFSSSWFVNLLSPYTVVVFITCAAGYLGSTFIGASLIFAGFDQKASKIAVFPVLFIMCLIMWWCRKDPFALCHVMFSMGILAALCEFE